MRDFNRDNRGGRKFGGGGRGGFGGDRQMFKAVCSNCGRDCEVPFKPTGSKPVLCNDCFKNAGGSAGRSDSRSPRPSFGGDRRDSGPREDRFEALNAKLDKILSLLEAKSISVPVEEKVSRDIELPFEEKAEEELLPEEPTVISVTKKKSKKSEEPLVSE